MYTRIYVFMYVWLRLLESSELTTLDQRYKQYWCKHFTTHHYVFCSKLRLEKELIQTSSKIVMPRVQLSILYELC